MDSRFDYIHQIGGSTRFVLASRQDAFSEAAHWAARADLPLRDWSWLEAPVLDAGALRVFGRLDESEIRRLAPLRSWERQ